MATPVHQRLFALFFAGLFLVSSLALGITVIYSNITRKDDTGDTSQQANNQENKNMLKGTQLANFTPVANVPDLQKIDTNPGTGEEVKPNDTVTVDYTGALAANGIIFESSKDSGQKATFGLNQVIKGWTEGLPGMKVGGTRRLLIPADQAYGNVANGSIPANSDLVFDITLYSVGK